MIKTIVVFSLARVFLRKMSELSNFASKLAVLIPIF